MAIDSKRIAKNTIFLYARLILVFGVTLYTSRVVLDKLGVDDYGLYNVVFSVIGMLSFLTTTLSSGTSRFITFDLGKKDKEKLKTTFCTALYSHLLLSVIILFLGETIGLWYVYNVMVCPQDRFQAALIVYQISIVTTIITILQVPFTSEVMAHEEMGVYAYIGIYEAFAKLLICYLLTVSNTDKLIFYAILMLGVNLTVLVFYEIYCRRKFDEVTYQNKFDRSTFKDIMNFTGWNVLATIGNTLSSHGVIMLLNIFFRPVVVTAQALTTQISRAMMQFVDSVRQAVNPQVIKLYADGKYEDSQKLTFVSAEYVFDLLMLLGIPLIMVLPALLKLWLVEVPEYLVAFTRVVILQDILGNFSSAFYIPMVAANKIQKNSIAGIIICIGQFVLLYILFKFGCGPVWARYVALFTSVIFGFVVKPYILWKDVDYKLGDIYKCIWQCMRTLITVGGICVIIYYLIPQNNLLQSAGVAVLSILTVASCALMYMKKSMRQRLLHYVNAKLNRR